MRLRTRKGSRLPQSRPVKSACGCVQGMVALALSMLWYVHYFIRVHADAYSRQQKIVAGCVIGLTSAAAGKTVGIFWARYKQGFAQDNRS